MIEFRAFKKHDFLSPHFPFVLGNKGLFHFD
ncbi:hypothetical protein CF65_02379 [Aggregatibacter actinomycetemcomitans HK1651]|nr:hypothetical protein CF65_02379 [Aggregatibacter actinomycetemcomitans HK1651]